MATDDFVCHGNRAPHKPLRAPAEELLPQQNINLFAENGFKRPPLNLSGFRLDLEEAGFGVHRDDGPKHGHAVIGAAKTPTGMGITFSRFNLHQLSLVLLDHQQLAALVGYDEGYVPPLAELFRNLKVEHRSLNEEMDAAREREKKLHEMVGQAQTDAEKATQELAIAQERLAQQNTLIAQLRGRETCQEYANGFAGVGRAASQAAPYFTGVMTQVQVLPCPTSPMARFSDINRYRVGIDTPDGLIIHNQRYGDLDRSQAETVLQNELLQHAPDSVHLLQVVPLKAEISVTL